MRNYLIVLAAFVTTSLAVAHSSYDELPRQDEEICTGDLALKEERTYGDYQISVSSIGEEQFCQQLEIRQNGRVVYQLKEFGAHFSFGADDESPWPAVTYITGMESPDLVISNWTGGAHCCFSLRIFNLGPQLIPIQTVEGGNSSFVMKDLNDDGRPEIEVLDDVFAYAFTSYASSPMGRVVLKFENDKYRVAKGYMNKTLPDGYRFPPKKIERWKNLFDETEGDNLVPSEVLQIMTDLVYSGHSGTAFEFLDEVWPESLSGKEKFIAEYTETLRESRYYNELMH